MEWLIGLTGLALVLGVISLLLGVTCLIKVMAIEKSTHQIVYHNPFDTTDEEVKSYSKEKVTKDPFQKEEQENWENSDEDIEKMNNRAKENLDLY